MKKIFMYLIVFIGFICVFFHGDKINILAYTQYDNTLGTYPAKLDVDNYDNYSLIRYEDRTFSYRGVDFVIENNVFTLNGTATQEIFYDINYSIIDNYTFKEDGYYSMVGEIISGTITDNFGAVSTVLRLAGDNDLYWYRFGVKNDNVIVNNKEKRLYKQLGNSGFLIKPDTTFDNFKFAVMLTEYDNRNLAVIPPFQYGNMVGYQLNLYNTKSYNITTNVSIKNYDNQVVNKSVTVNANSYYELKGNISINSQGTTDTRFYLPYNISSDGIISMDYKLSINITNPDIVIKSDENIQNDSYFLFEPVFNAYYNGEPTNNLYFKNSYVFNSLMYTGMNARGQGLNSLYFNCYGNVIDNYCIYDSLTIAPNTTENVLAFNVTSTGIQNNINFNDVFIYEYIDSYGFDSTSTLFSFQLNIGDTNTSLTSGVSYDINMSELTLFVINNSSTTSPLPNNPNTYNKYNVCDAWYDIPCQLGNAITYVIYEAPIISPVLTFIVTFITMFSSLVSFIDLFSSFGIVFGCFVIYMFIELLNKYSK